jgi:hypothetical protein
MCPALGGRVVVTAPEMDAVMSVDEADGGTP